MPALLRRAMAAGGSVLYSRRDRARQRDRRHPRLDLMSSVHVHSGRFLSDEHDHRRCVANALDDAEAVCAERGARLTPVRRRVLEIIWQSHRPLGAYAILEVLSGEGHSPAPPTVYRALEFLLTHGLVHRLSSLNAFIGCSPSRPSRRRAVSALHRVRHRGGAQRHRHRARDRAQLRGRGLHIARPHRRDQRTLSPLPRRLTAPRPGFRSCPRARIPGSPLTRPCPPDPASSPSQGPSPAERTSSRSRLRSPMSTTPSSTPGRRTARTSCATARDRPRS